MSYSAAIDLGSSFTAAAINRDGHTQMMALGERLILTPSVIRIQPNGSLAFGASGRADVDDDPRIAARDFKRHLGDHIAVTLDGQSFSASSLLAAIVSSVVRSITEMEGEPPERVALTYPATWSRAQREQFSEVPRLAGLPPERIALITEPEATATYYATQHGLSPGDMVAVYNLGGGVFDTAVLRVMPPGVGGEPRLEVLGVPQGVEGVGGIDFDAAILAHVDAALGGAVSTLDLDDPFAVIAGQRLLNECTRAKESLSHATVTDIVVALPHCSARIRLTRAELEDMIRPALESTMTALRRTMESAGVWPAELSGVVLVGGSSRIPLVSRLLSEQLGRPVMVDPHPQQCVALGAATIAENFSARTAETPAPANVTSKPPADPPRRRPVRLIAAGAATVLLIGAGAYAATSGRLSSEPPRTVGLQSTTTATTAPAPSTLAATIPSATPTTTRPPKPTPSKPKSSPKPKATPLIGFIGTVIGPRKKCLDVQNANPVEGAVVQIFECNGTDAQRWNGGTHQTLRAYGKCLAASGPDAMKAYQVLLRTCNGSAAQQWTLRSSSLMNHGWKLCLDTLGSKAVDYTPLVTRSCSRRTTQHWTIRP